MIGSIMVSGFSLWNSSMFCGFAFCFRMSRIPSSVQLHMGNPATRDLLAFLVARVEPGAGGHELAHARLLPTSGSNEKRRASLEVPGCDLHVCSVLQ